MVRRAEIWWVDWSPGRGSEQAGLRPALIVQNDIGNRYAPTTIVVAISANATAKTYPFQVGIETGESGLPERSVIKAEQILTVAKDRLVKRAGMLGNEKMKEVEAALHHSLGLVCGRHGDNRFGTASMDDLVNLEHGHDDGNQDEADDEAQEQDEDRLQQ